LQPVAKVSPSLVRCVPRPGRFSCASNNPHREKLQNCPKARSGDFDLDGLCADLQKKAKCDGTGPVVSEVDFQHAVKKYLCKDEQSTATVDALTKQKAVMQSQS
jgi:AP-1-like factor